MRRENDYRENKVLLLTNNGAEAQPLMELLLSSDLRPYVFGTPKRSDVKVWMKYGHVRVGGVVATRHDTPVAPGEEVALNLTCPWPRLAHPRL